MCGGEMAVGKVNCSCQLRIEKTVLSKLGHVVGLRRLVRRRRRATRQVEETGMTRHVETGRARGLLRMGWVGWGVRELAVVTQR